MTNAEKFQEIFKKFATEVWAFPEKDFLTWLNAEYEEPNTGHWVHGEYCSECGCDVPAYIIDWKWQKDTKAKYCPNCGAKMESEVKR